MNKQKTDNGEYTIIEFYVNTHRKIILNRIGESKVIAVIDSLPHTSKKHLYEEVIPFSYVNIVKRRVVEPSTICRSEGYRYTIIEEAVCLENQEGCMVISYILNIECLTPSGCNDKEIIDLVSCVASRY
ncbi:MAG: hypothetical protein QXL96_05015 [Ignisphaera sp.]